LVTVAVDRGLWSPRLADRLRQRHWQPLMRVQNAVQVGVGKTRRVAAGQVVAGPGPAWVGRARGHKDAAVQRWQTVLVVWTGGHKEPGVIFTDLPPRAVGRLWSGLRMGIEAGFRDRKRLGWQWERTRRRDPERVSRPWLVLALATAWALATGTAVADASPARRADGPRPPRPLSGLRLGCFRWLGILCGLRTVPTPALSPEPWPDIGPQRPLDVVYWTNPEQEPDVNLPL
jgi:hypothetical protein